MATHPVSHVNSTIGCLRLGRVTPRMLGAASAVAISAASLPAAAQQPPQPAQLPAISVEGQKPAEANPAVDYKIDRVQSPKITEPLLDVPQTINVVPQSLIEERAATTLRDALRVVPGITAGAGEGGGAQGDNFRIRGFAANNDMFVDGMRDMAQTTRDPFNLEQIEIFKGPSSSFSGRGSTGGSLNQVSKTAKSGSFQNGSLTLGTDETKRATVDLNQSLDGWMGLDGSAIRLNAMGHISEVEGRDYIEQNRWGFAPTISLGMNKPTRLTISYFHLSRDDTPDYGLPLLDGKVVSGTRRSGNYGLLNVETDEGETDVATFKIEHDFNDDFTLRNQFRVGVDTRYAIVSPPRINAFTVANGLSTHNSSNAANLGTGNTGANGGNASGRDSKNELLINQTDLTSRFDTGFANHTMVTGIELARETYTNAGFSYTGVPATSLYNPNPFGNSGTYTRGTMSDTEAYSAALYVSDTIKLSPQWELVGGLRWDYFDAETSSVTDAGAGTYASRIDRNISYRGAVVYKPIEITSLYAAYGTSFNPSAEGLSLAAAANSTSSALVKPEKNKTYEVGNKWEVLNKKLALNAALFRTLKTNGRTDDGVQATTDPVVLEGEQRVDGVEFSATGAITDKWKVYAGYTYMSSRIESSLNAAEVGNPIAGVPRHTATLWTTYELPGDFEVGFGATHVGRRTAGNSAPYYVDNYTIFDAMVGYHLTRNVDLQLNILNLTDEFYLEQVHGGGRHAVPGAGRTALLTTSFKF